MNASTEVRSATVTIRNREGMHARPVMAFIQLANQFQCAVTVRKGQYAVDGKSALQMMTLAATKGTNLVIEAAGADARQAIDELTRLVERKFDTED